MTESIAELLFALLSVLFAFATVPLILLFLWKKLAFLFEKKPAPLPIRHRKATTK